MLGTILSSLIYSFHSNLNTYYAENILLGIIKYKYVFSLCLGHYESESEVTQLCLTLCNPMECSQSGSSVHGIFQARILEWVAISFSRGFPDPGIEPGSPTL